MKFAPCSGCGLVLVGSDERACRPCLESKISFHTVAREQHQELAQLLEDIRQSPWHTNRTKN